MWSMPDISLLFASLSWDCPGVVLLAVILWILWLPPSITRSDVPHSPLNKTSLTAISVPLWIPFICVSKLPHLFGIGGSRRVAQFRVGDPLQMGMTPLFLLFLLIFSLSLLEFFQGGVLGGAGSFLVCSVYVYPELGVSVPGVEISTWSRIGRRAYLGMGKFSSPFLPILWASVPVFCVV